MTDELTDEELDAAMARLRAASDPDRAEGQTVWVLNHDVTALLAERERERTQNLQGLEALRGVVDPMKDLLRHLTVAPEKAIPYSTYKLVWDAGRDALSAVERVLAARPRAALSTQEESSDPNELNTGVRMNAGRASSEPKRARNGETDPHW